MEHTEARFCFVFDVRVVAFAISIGKLRRPRRRREQTKKQTKMSVQTYWRERGEGETRSSNSSGCFLQQLRHGTSASSSRYCQYALPRPVDRTRSPCRRREGAKKEEVGCDAAQAIVALPAASTARVWGSAARLANNLRRRERCAAALSYTLVYFFTTP